MICIAGASEIDQDGLGAFQESLPARGGAQLQTRFVIEATKYTARITDARRISYFLNQAMRYATRGRPGAVYVEIPGDILRAKAPPQETSFTDVPLPLQALPRAAAITKCINCLLIRKVDPGTVTTNYLRDA